MTALKLIAPPPSEFYLAKKPFEFFELLVKRGTVNREAVFDHLYGNMPDADQPQDTSVIDQMLVNVRRKCRTEGVTITTVAEGWSILSAERDLARKLVEISKLQPKRKVGSKPGASVYSEKEFVWKLDDDIPVPRHKEAEWENKYRFADMPIGKSFFAPRETMKSMGHIVRAFRGRLVEGKKPNLHFSFVIRERVEGGVSGTRVWRQEQRSAGGNRD